MKFAVAIRQHGLVLSLPQRGKAAVQARKAGAATAALQKHNGGRLFSFFGWLAERRRAIAPSYREKSVSNVKGTATLIHPKKQNNIVLAHAGTHRTVAQS
ncbi:MAG: hypothetical protein V4857_01485 [Pseudomonadota bacterium]